MFPKYLESRAHSAATDLVKQSWSKLLEVINVMVAEEEQGRNSSLPFA